MATGIELEIKDGDTVYTLEPIGCRSETPSTGPFQVHGSVMLPGSESGGIYSLTTLKDIHVRTCAMQDDILSKKA